MRPNLSTPAPTPKGVAKVSPMAEGMQVSAKTEQLWRYYGGRVPLSPELILDVPQACFGYLSAGAPQTMAGTLNAQDCVIVILQSPGEALVGHIDITASSQGLKLFNSELRKLRRGRFERGYVVTTTIAYSGNEEAAEALVALHADRAERKRVGGVVAWALAGLDMNLHIGCTPDALVLKRMVVEAIRDGDKPGGETAWSL